MTQVAVIHTAFEDSPRTVAFVDTPFAVVEEALEYAYRKTNNIMGSWSKGPEIEHKGELHTNPDYSEDVTVMASLEVVDGVEYGLRSTSMGDQMLIGTTKYVVDAVGFKELM